MATQYRCGNEGRRLAVRTTRRPDGTAVMNGIDYLTVEPGQTRLTVNFIHNLPGGGAPDPVPAAGPELGASNLVVDGGVRVVDVRVTLVETQGSSVTVHVDRPGDFSTYTLRLIRSPSDPNPPLGFDPQLSAVPFVFKVDCPSPFDCLHVTPCLPPGLPEPHIDYLARDYASLRQLMLDRLAVVMPAWRERNPADLGVALVEVLAYTGDHLSYFQDAVATEAYLGTARRRVSVRRHARLLDYRMHDGCNARAWVAITAGPAGSGKLLPGPSGTRPGTALVTMVDPGRATLAEEVAAAAVRGGAEVFETMHDITPYASNDTLRFYTWDDEECCLPAGATRATLRDDGPAGRLVLRAGDVVIFEERVGPGTGLTADADPTHRHVVRLRSVRPEAESSVVVGVEVRTASPAVTDQLTQTPIVEIEWFDEDALPFPLCISTVVDGIPFQDVTTAWGNVVLADHGATQAPEQLDPPVVPPDRPYRSRLQGFGITEREPFDPGGARSRPAAGLATQDPRAGLPDVSLSGGGETWIARQDLLASGRFDTEFVVETDDEGTARLRFGDGVFGRPPSSGLIATYRVGNGPAGNVGAAAIAHAVTSVPIAGVRNPLPAEGGTGPESTEQVRLFAPRAFRFPKRAVTEQDYAEVAQRHREVQKAVARLRWTGSWHTVFVYVDRRGGRPVDDAFRDQLRSFLEGFRMAGLDLEIEGPQFVPLDIVFRVCAKAGYDPNDVRSALLTAFGTGELPAGGPAFFHPDQFTFGQPVYLSRIIARAMAVPGVEWVDTADRAPTMFQRWGQPARGELAGGALEMAPLEIARVDNDPNAPENGRIDFVVEAGQ
ncbi:MAG: putative baseplate assembly protein [Actinomycetota bacterium]|nr:putative baseplate assembly protein [Actinomycetota bacterium]